MVAEKDKDQQDLLVLAGLQETVGEVKELY